MGKRKARIIAYLLIILVIVAASCAMVPFIQSFVTVDTEETFATIEQPMHETIVITLPDRTRASVNIQTTSAVSDETTLH